MNKQSLVTTIVVGLVVGFGLGYFVGQGITASSYQAQITKASAFFPQMTDVRSISGTVKSISGNSITVSIIAANPFDTSPTERVVTVSDKTVIVKDVLKDPKVYQNEMAAFQETLKKVQKTTPPATGTSTAASIAANLPTPPLPFGEVSMKLSDLKEGMQITVTAGGNIKTATTFEATRINVLNTATPPVGTVPPPVGTVPPPAAPATKP